MTKEETIPKKDTGFTNIIDNVPIFFQKGLS